MEDDEEEYEEDKKRGFKFVKQYLTLNRSELFFADKVICIEGDTERILMPAMMYKVDKMQSSKNKSTIPLLSQNISVIEVGAYSHVFIPLFVFLGIKALIITDIDSATKNNNGKYEKSHPNNATHTSNASIREFFKEDGLDYGNNQFKELIEKKEKDKKSVIPFLSILVENLKDEEITVLYKKYKNEEYRNPLGFLMVMMIFLFFFIAAGKQMKYSGNRENIKNNSEIIQNIPIKLNERKLIRVQDNIESEKTVEKNYKDTDMEEIDKMINNKNIGRTQNKRKKNMNKNSGKKIKNGRIKKDLSIENLESEIQKNWETSIMNAFYSNKNSILLEFTATADLKDKNVEEKYRDKIIYNYPLKNFRESGYTKDFVNFSINTDTWKRTLIALILSEYRRFLFSDCGQNIKPVIMLKSKVIKESRSFYDEFFEKINKLDSSDFENLPKEDKYLKKALDYFRDKDKNKTFEFLKESIRDSFVEEKAIIINGNEDNNVEKQLLLNSLEDKKNNKRIIFAVDMLNEGWDVLNLFDIVRLYDTRSSASYTIKEAQLIGRGARYCPFLVNEEQEKFKRKYDFDLDNKYISFLYIVI